MNEARCVPRLLAWERTHRADFSVLTAEQLPVGLALIAISHSHLDVWPRAVRDAPFAC